MDRNLLITSEEMKEYVKLPSSLESEDIDLHIRNAQDVEIAELLGPELFYELMNDPTEQRFEDLLQGKNYADSSGNTIIFPGLKVALIYYAYARYIGERGVQDTETGLVRKKNDWSEAIDGKEIARLISNARASGEAYQRKTIRFLLDNSTVYPLWNGKNRETSTSGFSIRAAGGRNRKTDYPNDSKNRC